MSLLAALVLLVVALMAIDLYRRAHPPARSVPVIAVLVVLLVLWLLVELLGLGGNVRL